MVCLEEMGFDVKKIKLHSLSDNKRYSIPLPTETERKRLAGIIDLIHTYDPAKGPGDIPASKCNNCIYNNLCVYAKSS